MHLCLFEDATVRHLAPLTLTRAAGDLRTGILTLAERQRHLFGAEQVVWHTRASVSDVTAQEHPDDLVNVLPDEGGVLFVNQRWLVAPEDQDLLDRVRAAASEASALAFHQGDTLLAAWHPNPPADLLATDAFGPLPFDGLQEERVDGATLVHRLWHLLDDVPDRITSDFQFLQLSGRAGATVHPSATLVGDQIALAPGAEIRPGAILNAEAGPIYLAEDAMIEEGAIAVGPLYLGPHARLKPAARVDGSAIGVHSKVGGEVHASIIHSFSSKAHDGYLGNSYLGRWCNLGADTNTSNLKNDYGEVTMWDAVAEDFVGTDRQFLGLVMGDHSKCSINTMFNTGTVVGVFCNLFGAGFPPRRIPHFSWGGAEGFADYRLEKALRVAEAVMARRDVPLTDADRALLGQVSEAAYAKRA